MRRLFLHINVSVDGYICAGTSAVTLGVLDEIRLVANPVLVGGGARRFGGTYPRTELRLRHTRQFASGAQLLTYQTTSR